jgi:hypothetical protein
MKTAYLILKKCNFIAKTKIKNLKTQQIILYLHKTDNIKNTNIFVTVKLHLDFILKQIEKYRVHIISRLYIASILVSL